MSSQKCSHMEDQTSMVNRQRDANGTVGQVDIRVSLVHCMQDLEIITVECTLDLEIMCLSSVHKTWK